jgi:hypothetical protein
VSRLALALTLLLPLSAASALPPVPPRTPAPAPLPDVVLPDVQPPPPPVPVPAGRVKLGADVSWVAYSDADFVVLASPEGLVKVTKEAGPLRVRGRFVEAPTVVQTKTFPGKFIVSVEAVASGKCDLLVGANLARLKRVCLDVAVGPAPPPDPPPGPGPGPAPDDALAKSFQAAYAAESDPQKAALLPTLAAFYRQGAKSSADAGLATWGDLFGAMSKAAQLLGTAGKLPAVQKAAQAELLKALPTTPTAPLGVAGRKLAADTFDRIAGALEAVKP